MRLDIDNDSNRLTEENNLLQFVHHFHIISKYLFSDIRRNLNDIANHKRKEKKFQPGSSPPRLGLFNDCCPSQSTSPRQNL